MRTCTAILSSASIPLAALCTPLLESARAAAGDLEIALTTEANAFVSDSVSATTADALAVTPGLRVGWAVTDQLTAELGWRSLLALSRDDHGYTLTTTGDALVVGARWALGLHPNVDVAFALELEALHADFDLAVGQAEGTTGAWSVGAIPKLIGMARLPIGSLAFDFRAFVGVALRTALAADDLHLASEAPRTTPLDLGDLDLSGVVFGTTFAIVF